MVCNINEWNTLTVDLMDVEQNIYFHTFSDKSLQRRAVSETTRLNCRRETIHLESETEMKVMCISGYVHLILLYTLYTFPSGFQIKLIILYVASTNNP